MTANKIYPLKSIGKINFLNKMYLETFFFLVFTPLFCWAQQEGDPSVKKEDPAMVSSGILEQKDKFKILERQGNSDFLRYKPIYFAYNNPITKIQFSFKSPIIEDIPLYFAYTQLIFWKLLAESKPFLDATYNPELFYRLKWPHKKEINIDIGIFEHNSNGKDGAASRSYNQTYARINYFIELQSWIIQLTGKFRSIYGLDPTNHDLRNYVGPTEFELHFIQLFNGWIDKSEFIINMNPGGKFSDKFDKGGFQLGYNFRLGGIKVVPAFYLQYYRGYGETLINYDQKVEAFRVGFLF
jgi:phospholipase A1/A2